jgi:CRISPR/Cas system-associated exonuclease Cas4 (RecB family)
MTSEPLTPGELLLMWDAERPRTQQQRLGWSDLGVCRRRVGYRLAGVEPSNTGNNLQAAMGSAVHLVQEDVLRRRFPDVSVEEEVEFAGILGHLDRYENGDVLDTKTTSSRHLQTIKQDGPPRENLWQINGYAAAVIASGRPVRRVILDYLARDTGEEHRWIGAPNPQMVREALTWLREVRDTELDWLPREYQPSSPFCEGCAFLDLCWPEQTDPIERDRRAVLFQEDPDAVKWARKLAEARADKADAERREAEAKGALDALRPNDRGSATLDVGYEKHLRWTVSNRRRVDEDRVRADYHAAGAETPIKASRSVTLTLVAPKAATPPKRTKTTRSAQ